MNTAKQWIAAALAVVVFSPLVPTDVAQAAGTSTDQVFTNSVHDLTDLPSTGQPIDKHKAYVVRRQLKAEEQTAPLTVEFILKARNLSDLQNRVARGESLSAAELAASYEPSSEDYLKAIQWLDHQGLTVSQPDPHHVFLTVTGPVSNLERALKTKFGRVQMEGRESTAALVSPSLPATFAGSVLGIKGLQPGLARHRHSRLIPADLNSSNPPYTPAQILQAYNGTNLRVGSTTLTGSGQTIAIVIDAFPDTNDLTGFWSTFGVSQNINNISFINVLNTPVNQLSGPSGEETLDTEWASSIAPGSQVRIYNSTGLYSDQLDAAYQAIYNDVTTHPEYNLHEMSMSYGIGEAYTFGVEVAADNQFFTLLSAAGVSIFASSGDNGSTPGSPSVGGSNGPLTVENPASDPNVTGVGGTTLNLNTNGSYRSESAWLGSGGGVSTHFIRPSWQQGTGVPSGSYRVVPDVAAVAAPATPAEIYIYGSTGTIAGTSWSAPIWAGLAALVNQARSVNSLGALGAFNPHLYSLIGTSSFHDIVTGNNAGGSTSGGLYSTNVGYDAVTGIGTPNVQNLVTALSSTLLPNVTVAPAGQTVVPGQSATMTATAGGSPTGYQWQRRPFGSASYANLSNGGSYSGVTTATLTISGATTAMSGDQYQCVVTYTGGTQVTSSSPAALAVDNPLTVAAFAGSGAQNLTNGTGTAAAFNVPSGVAVDNSGNVYVADYSNHVIRRITPAGAVSTPYGSLSAISGAANGTGNNATFNLPNGITFDGNHTLYVAEEGNSLIRSIDLNTGRVATLAGSAGTTGFDDGVGTSATFNKPEGLAADRSGNVYVADTHNHAIRKIVVATQTVSTLAGQRGSSSTNNYAGDRGYVDAQGSAARFYFPNGVAVDASGNNIYVADVANSVVRRVTSTGLVTTYAGQGGVAGYADGPALQATFNAPNGVTVDSSGNVYVDDNALFAGFNASIKPNNLIRRISASGVVSTLAGSGTTVGRANGTGANATFNSPQSIAFAANGVAYIADAFNNLIRQAVFPPTLTTSPLAQTVTVGQSVTFSVAASGAGGTFTYQWYFNGTAISGATGSSYTIASPTAANAGSYSVTVTSSLGSSTTTTPVLLTVNPPLTDTPLLPPGGLTVLALMLGLAAAWNLRAGSLSKFARRSA